MLDVTARERIRILRSVGAEEVRKGKGSHVLFRIGRCSTVVPVHKGEDLSPGVVRNIERHLAPCLGDGWLQSIIRGR
jgi:predicted RNA binding protein YcfA (HicA-like mRNA interferase family)